MSQKAQKQRIVLVDDHPMIREHIARVINKEPDLEVVGEADNVKQALKVIEETRPQLALVDLSLYEENGLDLVKTLKVLSVPVPVVVLTMHDDMLRAERAFRNGVRGYVTKHQPAPVILAAIRRVLEGKMFLSEDMIDTVLKKFSPGGNTNAKFRSVEKLSNREFSIFELIGRGQSSRAIAESLSISMETLASHRRRIKKKLDLHGHADLVHSAIQWIGGQR